MRVGSFMTGVIIGAVIGAAAALLFTPTSGGGMRDQIKGYFDNVKKEVNRAAEKRRSELETQLSELRKPQA